MKLKHLLFLITALGSLAVAQSDPVVATVANTTITKSQLELRFGLYIRDSERQNGLSYSEEALAALKKRFLELVARERAIILKAEAAGFAASKDEVQAAVAEVKADFDSEEAFAQALEEAGIPSLEVYHTLVYEALTYNAYLEHLLKQLKTSEPALRLLYLVSKSQFALPKRYCSAHILVDTTQEAYQVIARLGKGEKFADLARALSKDPGSKEEGGDLGCEPRGTFVAPFELALVALQPGESSKVPVKTEFGYHIILLKRVEAAGFQGFEEVRADLDQTIRNSAVHKLLLTIEKSTPIQLFPENL